MGLYFIAFLVCLGVCKADDSIVIDRTWQGGFAGHLVINPPQSLHGWKIHIKFDSPVDDLQVWACAVESHTGNEFVCGNVEYDGEIAAGASFKIEFQGSGNSPSGGTFTIDTLGHSGPLGSSGNQIDQGTGGSSMKYNYRQALKLSILFFDAQRSGKLPDNNPIAWRGDSGLHDGSDVGLDLTGGWYDAGDHVKFGLPMAWSSWVLNWGLLKFQDGYEAAGQTDMMCDMARWPLEYFLKAWRPSSQEFYVQVGDGTEDHHFWGRPENMKMERPSFKVDASCAGSDVAGKTVSALASGYLVYKDICGDAAFAGKLLAAAKSLYVFATGNRGKYTDCVHNAAEFYSSGGDRDELAAAGAWMYKVTKEQQYLDDAENAYLAGTAWGFNWNDDNVGAALLLYELTQGKVYKDDITSLLDSYNGGYVPKTPCGLSYRDQWGPNRHAANAAFVALVAATDGLNPDSYKTYALSQINYILGDNENHISFEIGFGDKYPTHPHHRGSSCSTKTTECTIDDAGDNPNVLLGGMVGGPDQDGTYTDKRGDYVHNEVACDYNAGFQSALAGLLHFAKNSLLPAAPAVQC